MKRRHFVFLAAACSALATGAISAAAQTLAPSRPARPYRDDLTTDDERARYNRDMRNARTERERERIRTDQRTRVDERARSRGNESAQPYTPPAGGWPDSTGANRAVSGGVPGAGGTRTGIGTITGTGIGTGTGTGGMPGR